MMKVVVSGAAGRMGRALIGLIAESNDLELSGAVESSSCSALGHDAGELAGVGTLGVKITDQFEAACQGAQMIIEFSSPEATQAHVEKNINLGVSMMIGTTSLSDETKSAVERLAQKAPVIVAPNTSLGMNLLFKLVESAAKTLGNEYDLEIIEAHHHHKKDAPSGSALKLAESAAKVLGRSEKDYICGREGMVGARAQNEIGILAVRAGDIVGDHTVLFAGMGERIELIHRAHSRLPLASGALRAARWLYGKKPGLYTMADVLGLN